VICCGAMAAETLTKLCWSHFEEDWQRRDIPHSSIPSNILKEHGEGRYRNVRQETFITPEAKRELQKYREWMSKRNGYVWSDDDFVFLDVRKPYSSLTYQGMATAIEQQAKILEETAKK
jgi:hypothetical protein